MALDAFIDVRFISSIQQLLSYLHVVMSSQGYRVQITVIKAPLLI